MFAVAIAAALAPSACRFDSASRGALGGPAWFQTFWEPCVQCCNQTRVGRRGDGGKWLCAANLRPSPTLLSVGSNNEFSFELDFVSRFGASSINVYDHTSRAHPNKRISFHATKVNSAVLGAELARLGTVDVLKVDCEGCELELFTVQILRSLHRMGTQILLEVHWQFLKQSGIVALWNRFASAGYGPFHKEPNIQYSDGSCVEYALGVI